MRKILFTIIAFIVCLGVLPSYNQAAATTTTPEPPVKVKLVKYLGNQTGISLKIAGSYYLYGTAPSLLISTHSYTIKVDNSTTLSLYDGTKKLTSGSVITIRPVNYIDHAIINNREYAGSFDFGVENGYVRPTNTINFEDYIKSVVPSEMPGSWPTEALKAQAVAARTFAYNRLGKTIDDTTYNQVYQGVSSLYPNSSDAVDATAGQILTYNGQPIDAAFSASNGGKTASQFNDSFTPGTNPYFKVQTDPYDTNITWKVTLNQQQIPTTLDLSHPELWWTTTNEKDTDITNSIKAWLNTHGYANKEIKIFSIPTITFSSPDQSGRFTLGNLSVQFYVKDMTDSNGQLALQTVNVTNQLASTIRAILDSYLIKSNLFTLTLTNGVYTFTGAGNGHGVGLSQYGAKNRAASSDTTVNSYNKILSFYYPGTIQSKQYVPQTKQLKYGWVSWGGKWYYFNSSGVMQTGWITAGGKRYFLDSNGVMRTGWVYYGYKWYYLDSSGAMKTGWVYTGGKWYYLNSSGVMQTGWVSWGGKWYYLNKNGAMQTGWVKIGTAWYYFYSSGAMAVNTTIQGHKINKYGVRVS